MSIKSISLEIGRGIRQRQKHLSFVVERNTHINKREIEFKEYSSHSVDNGKRLFFTNNEYLKWFSKKQIFKAPLGIKIMHIISFEKVL